jgi:hypothetical protein
MQPSSAKPYAGKRALDVLVAGAACAAFAPPPSDSRHALLAHAAELIALSFAVNLAGKGKVRRWLA